MADYETFTIPVDDKNVKVRSNGYINETIIDRVKFEFDVPKDITQDVEKNSRSPPINNSGTDTCMIYGGCKTVYDTNESLDNVYVADCIVQYRDVMKKDTSTYGSDYISVGIPEYVYDKFISDAKSKGIKVVSKAKDVREDGHVWTSCKLDKLNDEASVVYDTKDGPQALKVGFKEMLLRAEKTLTSSIGFKVGLVFNPPKVLMTDGSTGPVSTSGPFFITLKPVEIILRRASSISGPVIVQNAGKVSTTTEMSDAFVVDEFLAGLVGEYLSVE